MHESCLMTKEEAYTESNRYRPRINTKLAVISAKSGCTTR